MVKLRQPATPRLIVVKRGRRSCTPLSRSPACLWPGCSARLASDHDAQVCACHVSAAYNPHHDPGLHLLILHLLTAAYPEAVDLCAVLHCTSGDLRAAIEWLRRRGVAIAGARRGYALELALPSVHRQRRRRSTLEP